MNRLALLGVLAAASASAAPWPGEPVIQSVDLTPLAPGIAAGFGQQLSDLHWNPITRTLWVSRAPGGVWALAPTTDGGFEIAAKYSGINSDYEGITQADLREAAVYVLDETAGFIRKFAVDGAGGASLLRAWNLAGVVGPLVGNAGPEGLTFVPDESLKAAGFPTSARDGGGLFFVGHQYGGQIYVVDLDPLGAASTLIARLPTSRTETSALAFDRSSGRLYVSHNIGGNFLEVDALAVQPDGGLGLRQLIEFDSPNRSNLEGFAVTPQYSEDGGAPSERWCFWADDDGNSVGRPGLMWFRQLPAVLGLSAGNGQVAPALTAVAIAPAVTLRDGFSNEYVGQRVSFAATGGGGLVRGGNAVTSAIGLGAVDSWILGAAGSQQLTATASDFPAVPPVVFSATAVFADAGSLEADAGLPIPDGGDSIPDAGSMSDGGSEEPQLPARGCGCQTSVPGLGLFALVLLRRRAANC